MAPDSNELLAYRVEQLEETIKGLSTEMAGVRAYMTRQDAARGALLGAAGILDAVVAFLVELLFRVFNR